MKYQDIFEAAEKNDEEAVRKFVEKKNVRLTDTDYRRSQTAAHIATRNGYLNILKYLLDKEPKLLEIEDFYGNKIFYLAIENDRFDIVKYLVEKQLVSVLERNRRCFENTPIHRAAEYGHLDMLKYFLNQAGNADVLNRFNQTPIFLAAENKHYPVVKYLVEEKNANLTIVDHTGRNILYIALDNDDTELMKYLIEERKAPLDLNWKDKFGDTLVHRAAYQNKYQTLTYLVNEKNCTVNTADIWKQTPLHTAARESHYAVCKFLLEHGADTEMPNDRGELPVSEAKDPRIIEMIKEASVKFTVNHKRSRRSVAAEQLRPSETWFQKSIRMEIEGNSYPVIGYGERDILSRTDDVNSVQLQSFFGVAGMILSRARRLDLRAHWLSPREIVRNRMDPVAIDAIRSVPRMS